MLGNSISAREFSVLAVAGEHIWSTGEPRVICQTHTLRDKNV